MCYRDRCKEGASWPCTSKSANALSKSQSFPGLTPLFETAKGAVRYATDLGRSMADEGSPRLKV